MLSFQRKYFDNLCSASHTPEILIIQMDEKHYKWENRFPTEGGFFFSPGFIFVDVVSFSIKCLSDHEQHCFQVHAENDSVKRQWSVIGIYLCMKMPLRNHWIIHLLC